MAVYVRCIIFDILQTWSNSGGHILIEDAALLTTSHLHIGDSPERPQWQSDELLVLSLVGRRSVGQVTVGSVEDIGL